MADTSTARARPEPGRATPLGRFAMDASLPRDVHPPERHVASPRTLRQSGVVLLTGVTGFLGRWIAHELLTTSKARLICLVRGRIEDVESRAYGSLASTGLDRSQFAGRIDVVAADLTKASLGIDAATLDGINAAVDAICHAGATVNWVQSYQALKRANVAGTLELLRLAARRGTPFHFISSLSVCYSTMAPRAVAETYDALPDVEGLHLGYAQTKAVAEALVREAGRRGLPVVVYRPSLIAGHSATGSFNPDDIIARVVSGCVAMGRAPDLDWSLDCLPVDEAARTIVNTVPGQQSLHLAHHHPRTWREFVLWLRLYGYDVRLEPYDRWLGDLERATRKAGGRNHPLRPLRAFFLRRIPAAGERTLPEVMTGTDRDFGVRTAPGPALDAHLLDRYCRAFIDEGALPPMPSRPMRAERTASFDAAFFTRALGHPVRKAAPGERLTGNSIISELTSWRAASASGLFAYRLTLDEGHRDVVVKIKPNDHDAVAVGAALARVCDPAVGDAYERWSDRLGLIGAAEREAAIYETDDPRFRAHTPAALGVRHDRVSGTSTLIVERLTDTILHDAVREPRQWTPAYIDCAIRGLASLQAIWLDRVEPLARKPWIGYVPTAAGVRDMDEFWRALAAHARPMFSGWTDASIVAIQERIIDHAPVWWGTLENGPRTLIHNDFNPRNISLREGVSGPRLVAYDWELATIGAPQHDLAELLCFVLTEQAGARELRAWIERHRILLERAAGVQLERDAWFDGFRAALLDLMLNRLPMYALIHRVKPQSFLPRVVRTWRRLYEAVAREVEGR